MRLNCDTKVLRGELSYDRTMKPLNSWKVGGASECFYKPADLDDLVFFLRHCSNGRPITCLGMGSNVLVRDAGISGIVLSMKGALDDVRMADQSQVRAEAGVACARLAKYCVKRGLEGLEFLAGVPGTVGGALAMNAGAFGDDIWRYVDCVELIDRDGLLQTRQTDEFTVAYRQVTLPTDAPAEQWFTAGYFNLTPGGDAEVLQQRIKQLLQKRNETQPIGLANCGSVFKNPPNDYSARLIEACGLKGYVIGDAQVSDKHANFIINRGNASAEDIEALIHYVRDTVEQQTGIRLELEVKVIGGERA